MLISVVTPNRNGSTYIRKTLSSIFEQNNCEKEMIVIDGASIDNSLEEISYFSQNLSYFLSEPDKGMYDAINKGMKKAKGQILAYLNSDDFYYPGTLSFINRYFEDHPEVDLIYGDLNYVDENDNVLFRQSYPKFNSFRFNSMNYSTIGQPAAFWRRSLWESLESFDINLKMASDFDFFIRAGIRGRIHHVSRVLAAFRVHDLSMSQKQSEISKVEVKYLHQKYLKNYSPFKVFLSQILGNFQFKLLNIFNDPKKITYWLNKGKF